MNSLPPVLKVKSVAPLDNYRLAVSLSNGKKGVYDVSPLLNRGVFRELRDVAYFSQVRKIFADTGIGWPNEQDLSAYTLEAGLCALPKKSAVVRRAPRATARRPAATPVAPAKRAG